MYMSSGVVTSSGKDQKEGWFFLKCDNEIGKYYKWLYSRYLLSWKDCLNGVHITFISGNREHKIITEDTMQIYLGKSITFRYTSQIYTNGRAFWIPVICDELQEIRLSVGLPVYNRLHLTLGNNK